jgi:hypothetical protein
MSQFEIRLGAKALKSLLSLTPALRLGLIVTH